MDTERMPLLARPPAPLSNMNSPALTTATTTTTTATSSVSPLSYGSSSSPTHHVHSTSIDVDYSSDYMTLVSASVLPTPAHGYGTPGSVESGSGHHASTTASGKSVYDFANAGGLHPIRHTFLDDYLPFVHNKPFTHGIEHNITAGITVSLINIPLSIALAVASGSTPVCGVIAAVWGGLAASIFGGSQFNVTGPTGALSGMLARYVLIFGLGALPFVSMLSGAFMLLVFAMNWDKYVTYLPSSVAHGFTLGVAVILASSQINSICSLPPLPPHEHSILNLYESLTHLHLANPVSVIVFLVLWLTLFSLVQRWPKVPWSVAIAAVSIVIGYLSSVDVLPPLITLREKYGTLEAVLALPLDASRVNEWAWTDFVSASMSVAFVAVLESLISGKIADGLTKTTMNQRQETFGVAIANVLSGSLGGIPVTAALARTALNIRSGANNRISGVVCSISSLCIAYFLMPLFSYMPLCAISAMLVQVAVGMVESKHLRKAFSIDRGAFYLTIVVALLCVILDPTMAIVVGAVGGLLRFAQQSAMGYGEMTLTTDLHVGTKLDLSTVDEAVQHAHHSEHASGSAGGAVSGGAGAPAPHPPAQSFLQSIRESMFGPSELERQTRSIEHKLVSHDMMHHVEHHTVIYRVIGDLTYISAISHSQRLKHLENCDNVILSLRYCYFVDLDGLDSLEESISELRMRKKRVLLCGISPLTRPLFKRLDWYLRLEAKGWTFNLVEEAVAYIAGKQSQLNHPYLVQGSSPRSAAALHPDRRVLVDRLLPGGEVHSPAVLSAGGGTAAEASSARSSSARAPSKRDASPASASAATSRR